MVAPRAYEEVLQIPGAARFPIELEPPEGFDPERLETWPRVEGRLEHVEGRLLFMPPCGDVQQDTVTDLIIVLGSWVRSHKDFVLGTNEAGMRLRGATRAADAAIWRKADARHRTGGLRLAPPLLVAEVAGRYEPEPSLRDKAAWYLGAGVQVVWLVLPQTREVVVLTEQGESRLAAGERLTEHPALPDLRPSVEELFVQISED